MRTKNLTTLNLPPQQPASTRQPKKHKIKLPPRQQLHRDIEEARVARAGC
jgi:hypothetical protein